MKLEEYISRMKNAIEEERKEEEKFYRDVVSKKTIKEKVNNGVAWYPADIIKKNYTVGEYVEVILQRRDISYTHKIKSGQGVSLFINLHGEHIQYKGTVSYVRKDKMSIILSDELLDHTDISDKGIAGVELIYDERPYQIMREAMDRLMDKKHQHHRAIAQKIISHDLLDYTIPISHFDPFLHLNDSQNEAILGCMTAGELAVIHGPPGTGKTTTVVGLIEQLVRYESQVLVCAPSNNAVDLIAKKLHIRGVKVVRIGNITRIDDEITSLTVEEQVRGSQEWTQIKKIKIEAEELSKKANKYKRSFGPQERKLRYELSKEAREARKWAKELEYRLTRHTIKDAQVVLCTLVGASHAHIEGFKFNTCIIDEASQTLQPECWNAILKAQRVILVGDHKQLPPTVKSSKAEELGFSKTLLDLVSGSCKLNYLLNIQYRMNDHILAFSNEQYYDGRLKSATHVQSRSLEGHTPVQFIDTVGTGFEEKQLQGERSYFNEGEYFILTEHLLQIQDQLSLHDIGIITPYAQQVRHIRTALHEDDRFNDLTITVDSIDGFQGQEKDVIYLSLVRSNDRSQIGFLKDERRLNVALTRAKLMMVIIGDSATIGEHEVYRKLLDHIEVNEIYKSAWEYMS